MNADHSLLKSGIRRWLTEHPLPDDHGLDIHGVPDFLFDLSDADDRIKLLNKQIKALPVQQQQLLLYLSRDIDPALIIESMEYPSPELFWLDKALLIKEVDPTARQQDVLQVFAVNEILVEEILALSDVMDQEAEKRKSRKFRKWSLISVPLVLLLAWLFLYPLVVHPDTAALYDQFRDLYRPDLSLVDTANFAGGSFYEACLLMDEGNYNQSAQLFSELIPSDSTYRVSSRWFLSLISLRNGNKESCNEQLRAIRMENPVFYKEVAEKLFVKINR
jgi:hypothetical protein